MIKLLWRTFLHQDFLYFVTHPTVNTGQLTTTEECNEKSIPGMVKLMAECFEMPCKTLCYFMYLFVIWKEERQREKEEFEDKVTYVG